MDFTAKWIKSKRDMGDVCPVFRKTYIPKKEIREAWLYLTAVGNYAAYLNGQRIGDTVLAPGWTACGKRLQYQRYDVAGLLGVDNVLEVVVGKGWYRSPMLGCEESERGKRRLRTPAAVYGALQVWFADGTREQIITDSSWTCGEGKLKFSEIYDGEIYDAGFHTEVWENAEEWEGPPDVLISQEGEKIREQEILFPKEVIRTKKGEIVIDFGQEITGYVQFCTKARGGERIRILHGEVLDAEGNFYNDNYRGAKAEIQYICMPGEQSWHPLLTFFGFRYIKVEGFPQEVTKAQFQAIAVYSDMRRTGYIQSSDAGLNQLFSNIIWGQRGNFLDVPTDCPQRDERLGWTGDAQVFVKAACFNYDVERFFRKWLRDMQAEQFENGGIPHVVPDWFDNGITSAGWGDAAVICPWQIYLMYGKREMLEEQYGMMTGWVDYITSVTEEPYLWTGGEHYGDWLGLDAFSGSYKGASREDFIASAYYAYSTSLLIKAGKALEKDTRKYKELYKNIVDAFRKKYSVCLTQTEYVLSVWFGLSEEPKKDADRLAELIKQDGNQLKTGFVGTPYILHVLSRYGHSELAYTLLLRREYPSWLYPVAKGATTIWEHWDGIMEDGSFWSTEMNSFNHYAYGAVADWLYEEAAGIQVLEEYPGFSKVRIEPKPDARLEWLEASVETRSGRICSKWIRQEQGFRCEIETAVPAEIRLGDKRYDVGAGKYCLFF